jgi:hypothetical protein
MHSRVQTHMVDPDLSAIFYFTTAGSRIVVIHCLVLWVTTAHTYGDTGECGCSFDNPKG